MIDFDDERFKEIVVDDAKGVGAPGMDMYLREDATLDRWRATLVGIKQDLDFQYSAKKAEFDEIRSECFASGDSGEFYRQQAIYGNWKRSVQMFQRSIVNRIIESKSLIKERNVDASESHTHRYVVELRRLVKMAEGLIPPTDHWHAELATFNDKIFDMKR